VLLQVGSDLVLFLSVLLVSAKLRQRYCFVGNGLSKYLSFRSTTVHLSSSFESDNTNKEISVCGSKERKLDYLESGSVAEGNLERRRPSRLS